MALVPPQNSGSSGVAMVLFGPTQSSKSTTFARLCGDWEADSQEWAECGDGSGESVTVETSLRPSRVGLLLDTPGINDSRLRFTSQEAGRKVALGVAASAVTKVKFLVMESLANDSVQLRLSLVALMEGFGQNVLKSVVVLASKADCCKGGKRAKRLDVLREIGQKQGVQEIVVWQNEDLDEAGQVAQLGELQAALHRVPAVATRDLEDLDDRARQRARELCDQAPPMTEEKTMQVEEEYAEPRQEPEHYQEAYVDHESRVEQYEHIEPYKDVIKIEVPYQHLNPAPLAARIFSLGIVQDSYETRMRTVERHITKYRTVTKTRDIMVPVPRTRPATRMVTVYDTKTRTKDVTMTVQVRRPVEDFMAKALQQVLAEVRQTLTHT